MSGNAYRTNGFRRVQGKQAPSYKTRRERSASEGRPYKGNVRGEGNGDGTGEEKMPPYESKRGVSVRRRSA
jgi:hypothetical protein